jgi:hypothetical protein
VVPPPSLSASRKELVFASYFQVAGDGTLRQLHYQSVFVMLLLEGGGEGGIQKKKDDMLTTSSKSQILIVSGT